MFSAASLSSFVLFMLIGMVTMLLSVLLPKEHLGFNDAEKGLLFAMQFTGQLLGTFCVTRFTKRSLTIGILLTAILSLAIGFNHHLYGIALFLLGIGIGMSITATNILAGTTVPEQQRTSHLEVLNVFWPIGAALCPWALHFTEQFGPPHLAYAFVGFALLFLLPFLVKSHTTSASQRSLHGDTPTLQTSTRHLLQLAVMGLLATGVETAIAGWLPTFAARYLSNATIITVAASSFWVGELLGRAFASLILLRVRWKAYLVCSAIGCALAAIALSHATTHLSVCIMAFVSAFCVAPIYPAVLAKSVHLQHRNIVFFAAGVGSAVLPWLVGALSTAQSLRISMMLPVAGAFLMAFFFSREEPPQKTSEVD